MSLNDVQGQRKVFQDADGQMFTVHGSRVSSRISDKVSLRGSGNNFAKRASVASIHSKHSEELQGSPASRLSESLRGRLIPLQRQSYAMRHSHLRDRYMYSSVAIQDFDQSTLRANYIKSMHWTGEDWVMPKKLFRDHAYVSRHPSYTIKNIAYHLECNLLYLDAKEKYNNQLLREMQHLIDTKRNLGDQYFTKSILSYSTLWPPLHTKREIQLFNSNFFQLTPEEKKRLDVIMKTDLTLS